MFQHIYQYIFCIKKHTFVVACAASVCFFVNTAASSASSAVVTGAKPTKNNEISKKSNNSYTMQNGRMKKTNLNNDFKQTDKPLKKPDLSEKHLGYKAKKTANVGTFTRSKLNHDTASYRAKFEGKGNPNDIPTNIPGMKKGMVAGINDLTKNGFQTSIKRSQPPKATINSNQLSI